MAIQSVKPEFVLPCRAAELRGVLRHSHLQNRFLTWFPTSPDLIRRTYECAAPARQELDSALRELADILADAAGGFSPIHLLDELRPLKNLPEDLRQSMKSAITRTYLSSFDPADRAAVLRSLAYQFISALDKFLADSGESVVLAEGLRVAAEQLYDEISKLPKGIWLWPEQDKT